VEAPLQTLTLLGAGVWVRHDKIGGLGVPSSSSESVPSIRRVLLHSGGDSVSSRLLPFPSQSWGCGP